MKYTREMKNGFWSPHCKESVVQKLGAIEKEAPELLDAYFSTKSEGLAPTPEGELLP